jgi:hypothetical protein
MADAKKLLDRVEQKAARLRSAIRTFKESKAAGEPRFVSTFAFLALPVVFILPLPTD